MKHPLASLPGPTRDRLRAERGFTLIEVMIAVLVLSIGLLGISALQALGLRSSYGAYLGSQAALLAYDISDRIRANPNFAAAYRVNCADEPAPANPLAAADVAEWCASLANLLPSGTGSVGGNGNNFQINVSWRDNQLDPDADPWSFNIETEL